MMRRISGWLPHRPPPRLSGTVSMPASKSQTVRALLVSSMASGESCLRKPLECLDSYSCRRVIEAWGARVTEEGDTWKILGIDGLPRTSGKVIDVGNSGTTLYLATALAALGSQEIHFDGDEQLRGRSAENLLLALEKLGAQITRKGVGGCAPYSVKGPLRGGWVSLESSVSQYLSALLLAAPLIRSSAGPSKSIISVILLNEAPYVGLTLGWLDSQGIQYTRKDYELFSIPGGQSYRSFDQHIPGDWSSATFFFAAAAITGSTLTLSGLDMEDPQGDKEVLEMLEAFGCRVESSSEGIRIQGRALSGVVLDLNDTPDALPALAAVACFARGETRLENVPQARMKETDRIALMASELRAMGADIEELPDGLIIRGRGETSGNSPALRGTVVKSCGDHRVVMALAIAALGAKGETSIMDAEAVDVTFPNFFSLLEEALIVEEVPR